MKKFLIASGVAVLAFASVAGAQSYQFNTNLTIGSTGADVVALQNLLISKGYSIPAISSGAAQPGYFGSQTKTAVMAYQAANGVPNTGFFGPLTRASVNAGGGVAGGAIDCPAGMVCTPTVPVQCPIGFTCTPIGGGAPIGGVTPGVEGSLDRVTTLGDVETLLDEGDRNEKIVGVEFRAKDSAASIQRVDVEFDLSASTGSTRLDRYVSDIHIVLDGKVLASMPASQVSRSGSVSTARFTGINGVVGANQTGRLYVTVDAVNTIGAAEDGQTVSVTIPTTGVRVVDGAGISETYFSSPVLTGSFQVSTATAGKITITEASGNPAANQVKADDNNVTSGVKLMVLNLRARNSGIEITDLPIGLTSTVSNLNGIIQNVKLMQGSTVLRSKTVSTAGLVGTVTFDNVNLSIPKDGTITLTVVADVKALSATFASSTTLVASTTGVISGWDVEDDTGSSVTLEGSAVGGVVTFKSTGITVEKISSMPASVDADSGNGLATFRIPFSVTADDDVIYITEGANDIASGATPSGSNAGNLYSTTTSAATIISERIESLSGYEDSDTPGSYFRVGSGASRNFVLVVEMQNTSTTTFTTSGVGLRSVNWGIVAGTQDQHFTANLNTFVSPSRTWKTNP